MVLTLKRSNSINKLAFDVVLIILFMVGPRVVVTINCKSSRARVIFLKSSWFLQVWRRSSYSSALDKWKLCSCVVTSNWNIYWGILLIGVTNSVRKDPMVASAFYNIVIKIHLFMLSVPLKSPQTSVLIHSYQGYSLQFQSLRNKHYKPHQVLMPNMQYHIMLLLFS
jgi:hypothetical protein